ncbi:MAG: hypothetical protein JW969_18505 [Spirochaetales bacterium]|nr:hypothetical protein [Spirochaetales bacterium]
MNLTYRMVISVFILFLFFPPFLQAETDSEEEVKTEGPVNLIKNGDFEEVRVNMPVDWYTEAYLNNKTNVEFFSDANQPYSGKYCATINNKQMNDAKFVQDVMLEKGIYKLSCQVRVSGIVNPLGGANLTLLLGDKIQTTPDIFGPQNIWTSLAYYINIMDTPSVPLQVQLRLGGFGAINLGTASYDAVILEKVDDMTEDLTRLTFVGSGQSVPERDRVFKSDVKPEDTRPVDRGKGPNYLLILILLGGMAAYITLWLIFMITTENIKK